MIVGLDPLEGGDHLNLETCVDNIFKVVPKDKEESMYINLNFLLVQLSLELSGSQMGDFILYNLLDHSVVSFGKGNDWFIL